MHLSTLAEPCDAALRRLDHLVSPTGLVSDTTPLHPAEGEPQFAIHTSMLGDPSRALPNVGAWEHRPDMGNFDGAGGALGRERARLVSIAESLERYSSCAWDDDRLFFATEGELGDDCVSPTRWPRCSEGELAHPSSTLAA